MRGVSVGTTLKAYRYGFHRVDGVCLQESSGNNEMPGGPSKLTFRDDDEDGLADRVELSGYVATQGQVSSDWDSGCGQESAPLRTTGRVVKGPPTLAARGNALRPSLLVEGGFLSAGVAELQAAGGESVDADVLEAGGLIYGFSAPVVVAPESEVTWQVAEYVAFGEALEAAELAFIVEPWPALSDGSFEASEPLSWPEDAGLVEATCEGCETIDGSTSLPAISGEQSLLIGGASQRFLLSPESGQTRLSFLALDVSWSWTSLALDIARVGGAVARYQTAALDAPQLPLRPTAKLASVAADCATYPHICSLLSEPTGLRQYTVDLPAGDGDVLITVHDASLTLGIDPEPLWLDDLRLE